MSRPGAVLTLQPYATPLEPGSSGTPMTGWKLLVSASLLLCGVVFAQTAEPRQGPATTPSAGTAPTAAPASTPGSPGLVRVSSASHAMLAHEPQMPERARQHYRLLWGVDQLDVKAVESGQMIRFSYAVLDPQKAATLNDKAIHPFLIDEQAHVKLEIPTMEKVGQLRQSAPPEAGRNYWMVFSNKGSVVKPGDRVTIVIGHFKAEGLYVR